MKIGVGSTGAWDITLIVVLLMVAHCALANIERAPTARSFINEIVANSSAPAIVITKAGREITLIAPQSSEESPRGNVDHYFFEADAAFRLDVQTSIGVAVAKTYTLSRVDGGKALDRDLTISVPLPVVVKQPWLPLKNGSGFWLKSSNPTFTCASFRSGSITVLRDYDLAIPLLISEFSSENPIAIMTDPFLSSEFCADTVSWTYSSAVGLEDGNEVRTLVVQNLTRKPDQNPAEDIARDLVKDAVDSFYRIVLADVPPGPSWLHDIALVDYDFMSDGGRGWYNDLTELAVRISAQDRSKVFVTLHGWYDSVGRYSRENRSEALDSDWMSFRPNVGSLSVEKIRQRLQFAKSLGFRVGLYFADGVQSGSEAQIASKPSNLLSSRGYWTGPDLKGFPVLLNPAQKEVYDFYLGLARAEMKAFGDLVDALVWDETFFITAGNLGSAQVPSYLARTFMRLVRDVATTVHQYNPNVALLTSDVIGEGFGAGVNFNNVPPYALFADGTYQDAHADPKFWSYALFPNLRNVSWGCTWNPVTAFDRTVNGVRNFQAPVSLSNGWGDDTGFSEMAPAMKQNVIDLFRWRAGFSTSLRWLKVRQEQRDE